MKNVKNRVGLEDISEEQLSSHFIKVTKEFGKVEKELNKIHSIFKGLKAQERLILFDIMAGALIDMSNMSTFLVVSILEKYKNLTLNSNHTNVVTASNIGVGPNVSDKPTQSSYIG